MPRAASLGGGILVLAGAAVSAVAVASAQPRVAASAASGPATVSVSMKEFMFMPASVSVHAGDTVRWTYDESATDPLPNCETVALQPPFPVNCPGHSTTAVDKGADGKPLWDSGVHRAAGYPYTHTFATPGT